MPQFASRLPDAPSRDTAADDHHEILLVDDDLLLLEELWETIQIEGHICHVANDPKQAVERALDNLNITTIITDLSMPGMNGLEMIREIKARSDDSREFHFIVLTGNATVDAGIEAIRLGVSEFLKKPTPPEDLLTAINRAFSALNVKRAQQHAADSIIADKNTAVGNVWESIGLHEQTVEGENMARHEMLSMLADEIHGPLSTIIMLADGMRDDRVNLDAELCHDYNGMIIDKGKEILRKFDLVCNLATRIGGNNQTTRIDIRELLTAAIRSQGDILPAASIRLLDDDAQQPLLTYGNPKVLNQVFTLLFRHIAKDHDAADRVWIGRRLDGSNIQISMLIAPTDAATFNISRLQDHAHEQSGRYQVLPIESIELSSARILLKLYGGDIHVKVAQQVGSLITVEIPRQAPARAA